MCPLFPFHYILLYLLAFMPLLLLCLTSNTASRYQSKCSPVINSSISTLNMTVGVSQVVAVHVYCAGWPGEEQARAFVPRLSAARSSSGDVPLHTSLLHRQFHHNSSHTVSPRHSVPGVRVASFQYSLLAHYPGYTKLHFVLTDSRNSSANSSSLNLRIVRDKVSKLWSRMFGYAIAVLMTLTFVKMGCVLDMGVVREQIRLPIGPFIGIVCQYLFMPIIGFTLSTFLTNPVLQLGVFLTGCSPGGGASNLWTYLLNGNVNLSVTMTAISMLFSLIAMPFWCYVFSNHLLIHSFMHAIPYAKICTLLMALVIPCLIGVAINYYLPKISRILRFILRPWCIVLFMFIIIFGIATNTHLYYYIQWPVILCGLMMPSVGFLFAMLASLITMRTLEDSLAICIEVSVQNTGITIFMLKLLLPEPANDISLIAPVTVATFTPLPLIAVWCLQRLIHHRSSKNALTIEPSMEKYNSKVLDVGKVESIDQTEAIYRLISSS